MAELRDVLEPVLPDDAADAVLAGRIWWPDAGGPSVVAVRDGALVDVSAAFPTMRDLCEATDPAAALRAARGEAIGALAAVLENTPVERRDRGRPWLLAPIGLNSRSKADELVVCEPRLTTALTRFHAVGPRHGQTSCLRCLRRRCIAPAGKPQRPGLQPQSVGASGESK